MISSWRSTPLFHYLKERIQATEFLQCAIVKRLLIVPNELLPVFGTKRNKSYLIDYHLIPALPFFNI